MSGSDTIVCTSNARTRTPHELTQITFALLKELTFVVNTRLIIHSNPERRPYLTSSPNSTYRDNAVPFLHPVRDLRHSDSTPFASSSWRTNRQTDSFQLHHHKSSTMYLSGILPAYILQTLPTYDSNSRIGRTSRIRLLFTAGTHHKLNGRSTLSEMYRDVLWIWDHWKLQECVPSLQLSCSSHVWWRRW